MVNEFYVYCHRKKTNGECFYIGKGKGYRHSCKTSRNQHWYNVVNKHGFTSEILINGISETKAFELEYLICEQIGYNNLVNIREEKGWGGYSHSYETKKKMSNSHKGKSKPWVAKYRTGFKDSKEIRLKKSQPKTEEHKKNLSKSLKGLLKGREITWDVGRKKGQKSNYNYSKRVMDYSNAGSKGKKLYQKDMEGNLIKIWNNKKQASEVLNLNMVCIGNVCLGKQESYKNFKWSYE